MMFSNAKILFLKPLYFKWAKIESTLLIRRSGWIGILLYQ